MASKLPRVVPTCHEGGFGSWFELDWADHPNHSMTTRHVTLAEQKLTTYIYVVGWLHDMESIFRICHIEAHLQVPLASQYLAVDARLWWMSLGESAIPGGSWADFRALIIARYEPLPDEEANMSYRDPDIYNDMYMRPYLNYAAEWQAYANESMGHYCRRFQDAMLPYIPQDIGSSELQALCLLRDGLPLGHTWYNNEVDPVDFLAAPEDQLKDPPIIIIVSDDDEEDVEEEWEEFEGMEEEIEDVEHDLEEILFGDDDWDVFSDVTTE
ncbi:hypothetical protein TIFTF001_013949 [Ficus carica]|uniref:Uncharacterized protein n=1 Tax=Ficus carica TaxID=3494 RepID=A0AA88AF71_FICCA|nr:hypothetical protein TIFTF001_013949 [Ficus carica]